LIKVRDNGIGINSEDLEKCAARHYTSKIDDFKDLEFVETYGFRGEALSSICLMVGEFEISSRTSNDDATTIVILNKRTGKIESTKKEKGGLIGTTVCARKLFDSEPVRKEHAERDSSQAKKIKDLVIEYALIRPDISFKLSDSTRPTVIFHGNTVKDALTEFFNILPREQLCPIHFIQPEPKHFTIDSYFPSCTEKQVIRASNDLQFIFVNTRPVDIISIKKVINKHLRKFFNLPSKKYPFFFSSRTSTYS